MMRVGILYFCTFYFAQHTVTQTWAFTSSKSSQSLSPEDTVTASHNQKLDETLREHSSNFSSTNDSDALTTYNTDQNGTYLYLSTTTVKPLHHDLETSAEPNGINPTAVSSKWVGQEVKPNSTIHLVTFETTDPSSTTVRKEDNLLHRMLVNSNETEDSPSTTTVVPSSTSTFSISTTSSVFKLNKHNISHEQTVNKVPLNRRFNVPYFANKADVRRFEMKHGHHQLAFKHHLQLVPMEDPALESDVMKNHRYLISILVPVAIGGVGAIMIVVTVLTLRYLARKRPHLNSPFNNDTTADSSARISSVSTGDTDRVFLLLGDQDEE